MKKSRFSNAQITYALRQIEAGWLIIQDQLRHYGPCTRSSTVQTSRLRRATAHQEFRCKEKWKKTEFQRTFCGSL